MICDANYFSTRSGEPQHDGKSCLSRFVSACQSYRGHTGTKEQRTKDDGTAVLARLTLGTGSLWVGEYVLHK